MAVHGAESESSSFKESLVSGLGYRAFSWCCLSVLGECMACLLQHRCTSKRHLASLDPADCKIRPYHHGVEVFYNEKAISVQSAHRECYGTPRDEDKTCSRSKRPFLNLPESVTRHKNYFNITFGTFCKESSSLQEKGFQFRKESCTSCN